LIVPPGVTSIWISQSFGKRLCCICFNNQHKSRQHKEQLLFEISIKIEKLLNCTKPITNYEIPITSPYSLTHYRFFFHNRVMF
jgi:hypothetical protein